MASEAERGPVLAGRYLAQRHLGDICAATVVALLAVAVLWGRSAAGLLAGLPTVSGPALVWLAQDHGLNVASQAAVDAVAAEAPCAVFAWGHCWSAARSDRLLAGLLSGVAQAALAECAAVTLIAHLLGSVWLNSPPAQPALLASVLLASRLVCLACLRQPVSVAGHPAAVSVLTRYSTHGGIGHPAAVSGLVTALVSLLAPQVGALGAGILSPLPLLAAGLAWMMH